MNRQRTAYLVLILSVVLLGIIGLVAASAQAAQAHRTEYLPCGQGADEAGDPDGPRNCVHDARHEGNGLGNSFFVAQDGTITPLPHHIAHYLIYGSH